MSTSSTRPLTIRQVCEREGISRSTAWAWVRKGHVRVVMKIDRMAAPGVEVVGQVSNQLAQVRRVQPEALAIGQFEYELLVVVVANRVRLHAGDGQAAGAAKQVVFAEELDVVRATNWSSRCWASGSSSHRPLRTLT
jgi:hypothetical protein